MAIKNCGHIGLDASPDCWHETLFDLDDGGPSRFTSIAVEMLDAIEATLENAKTNGIKPESVAAVKATVHQLIRNNGVRESGEVSGRDLFAQYFVWEVETILEPARHADPSDEGPLTFYMLTLARKLEEYEAIEKPLQK